MRIILAVVFLSGSLVAQEAVDRSVLDELQTEGVKAWQDFESNLTSVRFVVRNHSLETVAGENVREIRSTTIAAWNCVDQVAMCRSVEGVGLTGIYHDVSNLKYEFEVLSEDAQSRGVLREVRPRELDTEHRYIPLACTPYRFRNTFCGFAAASRLGTVPLSLVITAPEFECEEAARQVVDGKELLHVAVRYHGEEKSSLVKDARYSFFVDPASSYRMVQWTWEIGDDFRRVTDVFYAGNTMIPERLQQTTDRANSREHTEATHAYSEFSECTIPKEEFYLPHYGFSEQVLETLNPNPWPRWLLVLGGILSLVIGGWLLRRRPEPA